MSPRRSARGRFLYLDNWATAQTRGYVDEALEASGLAIERHRTNEGRFPSDHEFCGVYVSPSFNGARDDEEWIPPLKDHLVILADAKVPILGLCFGSQVLAAALFGNSVVTTREVREMGYGPLELSRDSSGGDPLLAGLPEAFEILHWHGDEVGADHPDIEVLAANGNCANQIWRWRNGPAWGVQPHPEYGRDQAMSWFDRNAESFVACGASADDFVPRTGSFDAGHLLIDNFIGLVTA